MQPPSECRSRHLRIPAFVHSRRAIAICQKPNAFHIRDQLTKELQSLCGKSCSDASHSCDVTARPIQAGNDSLCDWVGSSREYNGNVCTYTCVLNHLCGTDGCRS